jgi:thymidylate synthase ThyX
MANIFIYDEFSPEDTAMMQALYSRSPQSVVEHAEKVKQTGSGKFMERFYVGYGHASIADCGSTTLFIEGVSMLCDKAIQDWPLYSGQETSTRYNNMLTQPIIDPVASEKSKAILSAWMNFYSKATPMMEYYLSQKHPKKDGEDEAIYKKAIKARAFDILRGFLPAGITTKLSWHTNLRQAWDKIALLRYCPLPEVQIVAEDMLRGLKEKYPSSFSHKPTEEQELYRKYLGEKYFFYDPVVPVSDFSFHTDINPEELKKNQDVISSRPPKTNLPLFLFELGTTTFDFLLDYGSFRDVHRHRNGICRVPLLTTKFGFNQWYLDELSDELRSEANGLIEKQKLAISSLEASDEIKQYYIALGFNSPCRISYTLPATVYVVELRSGKMVHPTLRRIALKMREALLEKFPNLVLYCDTEPSEWDISRGKQDIVEKNSNK